MRFPRALLGVLTLAAASLSFGQDHGYDLLDVNWELSFDEAAQTIAGSVTNTVKLTRESEGVRFHAGRLTISAVRVNGLKGKFRLDPPKEQVIVDFPARIASGTTVKVSIDYTGKPQAGVFFTPVENAFPAKTSMVYTQGEAYDTRYWLPTYDHPGDKATSESKITVPIGYYALGNGKLMSRMRAKGKETFHWKMEQPHSTYLISFVAGAYDEVKDPPAFGTIPVTCLVPAGMADWGKASFGGSNRMVEFYSELTGYRYPYAKFSQSLVADFPFGGMENITAVTNTLDAMHPEREKPFASAVGLNLHEMAHQWFGDLVTCRDYSHLWINEGFASFLPNFWVRREEGEDEYHLGRRGTLLGAVGAMQGKKRTMIEESAVAMDNFDGHAYGGGAARMYTLMALLGEEQFWKSVKAFLNEFAFQPVTTEDFFNSFSKSSGKDLSFFRKEWFYTAAMPSVKAVLDGNNLKLTQTQPYFTLDLDVWVWDGSAWRKEVVALHGASATVPLGSLAKNPFTVDPEVKYAAAVDYDVATPQHATILYQNAPNAALKARMIDLMRSKTMNSQLTKLLESETSPTMRRLLLEALPADETDRWFRMSTDPDARLRMIAIQKMSAGPLAPKAVARLQAMSVSEINDSLKLAALRGYVVHSKDEKAVRKAWQTDSYGDSFRRYALDWFVGQYPDEGRQMALASLGPTASFPLRTSAIRHLGRLKDKLGEKRVYQALVEAFKKPGYGIKQACIGALADYGDRAAIPLIQPYTTYSQVFVAETARNALDTLRKK